MASCICIRDPRRGRHWRSPQSARPCCCRRFVEVEAARVAGGLSTSQSCTLAKMSSFLTSRAGGRADCQSIRMRPSSHWLPIGCAKCFRLQRAELIRASSEPSTLRARGRWLSVVHRPDREDTGSIRIARRLLGAARYAHWRCERFCAALRRHQLRSFRPLGLKPYSLPTNLR